MLVVCITKGDDNEVSKASTTIERRKMQQRPESLLSTENSLNIAGDPLISWQYTDSSMHSKV